MSFTPNYEYVMQAVRNEKPARLPLYEHLVNPTFMEKLMDVEFAELINGNQADLEQYFGYYCRFFRDMTYDIIPFESCITEAFPEGGAIMGGHPGPIQNRADFDAFPWDDIPRRFWAIAEPRYQVMREVLPEGMKALGGVGTGVFEIAEDLVGLEYLSYMQADDPELFDELFDRIGTLMHTIWSEFLTRHSDMFAVCRFGDDLGFKTATLTTPDNIRRLIVPHYRRLISTIHQAGKLFLYHSCGHIFSVMDDIIDAGIDAKHSNEDGIAPFDTWIERYNDRIALFGGIDLDVLCRCDSREVYDITLERGTHWREKARGYALGSGNSIPDYVPVENYQAMIRAAQEIRRREG